MDKPDDWSDAKPTDKSLSKDPANNRGRASPSASSSKRSSNTSSAVASACICRGSGLLAISVRTFAASVACCSQPASPSKRKVVDTCCICCAPASKSSVVFRPNSACSVTSSFTTATSCCKDLIVLRSSVSVNGCTVPSVLVLARSGNKSCRPKRSNTLTTLSSLDSDNAV